MLCSEILSKLQDAGFEAKDLPGDSLPGRRVEG